MLFYFSGTKANTSNDLEISKPKANVPTAFKIQTRPCSCTDLAFSINIQLLCFPANFRGDMIHCYHNPCDDLDTMLTDDNLEFLNKTTDALIDTMHHLSEPSRGI